ncbi:MAG TPA: dihydrolipoyl dehydrogenase, partial [Firmicutes bacterium]|nr:dihydrolipoyl dehydrogenase [Bacillota bacterium]
KAREQGINIKVHKSFFKASGKAVVEAKDAGLLKLIEDKDKGVIIGISAAGNEIADLINEAAVIIASGITVEKLKNIMHIHPSYSEMIIETIK